jgi:hypothetical protein
MCKITINQLALAINMPQPVQLLKRSTLGCTRLFIVVEGYGSPFISYSLYNIESRLEKVGAPRNHYTLFID